MTTVNEAYRECRAIAHKHGANFSVGFRFLPRVKRRAVYAAYTFCRIADDIADEDDPGVALNIATNDGPSPGAPRHPLPASGARGNEGGSFGDSPSPITHHPLRSPSPRLRGEGARRADEGRVLNTETTQLRMLRLDAWQRELDACYAGQPTHPVTIALADALQHFDIPKQAFEALIAGCRQDMVKTRYETFEELLDYCELVASSISDISLSIFGYRSDAAIGYGRKLSTALQLTNVTRDVGDDLTRDRVYIPRVELERFGVTEAELFARSENERVRRLIEFQIARAEEYFREAEPLLHELAFDARFPTLLMGGVYATVLGKLRKDPMLAIRKRLKLSPLQKILVVGTRMLRPHFV